MSGKYKLVIVESPAKAKTIEKYLGAEYRVIASKGHILDLPKNDFGVDLETFETKTVPIENKIQTIKEIVAMAKNASEIFLASDPDREGEIISEHLKQVIKRKDLKRVLFHSITKPAILEAIKNAGIIDEGKCNAQQTRRILDRIIGYKISPILKEKLRPGLSAGRVQSVTLKLIVERENKIRNFIPEKWFDLIASFEKNKIKFQGNYFGKNKESLSKLRDRTEVDEVLTKIKGKDFIVTDTDKKDKATQPQPPYTTSKLQQEASSKLKFPAKDTMRIAQKLYEGIEFEGGRTGLITYMRTDSVRSDPAAIQRVRELIKDEHGENYLSKEIIIHKHKKSNSKVQDAHEAIRPANLDIPPSKVEKVLGKDEFELYRLIWNKFMASQMSDSISQVTTVFSKCEDFYFRTTGSVLVFDGHSKVISGAKSAGSDDEADLPTLIIGEVIKPLKEVEVVSKESSPPSRFTEGTLVRELEEKGVGRPSTYANIISNISDRSYVYLGKDLKFNPSELGEKLCAFLEEHFPVQMDVAFTSKTEETLDDIEEGEVKYKDFLKEFWGKFNIELVKARDAASLLTPGEMPGRNLVDSKIKCLLCKEGSYLVRPGSKGEFLSCSKYPECKSTQAFKKSKKGEFEIVDRFPKKYSDQTCKICSKRMVIIDLPDKKFLSCEDYPACKFSMPIPSKIPCPTCKTGRLSERKNKDGESFVGCSEYPKCNFVSWDSKLKKCKHCTGNIQKTDKDKKKACLNCKK